MRLNYSIIMSYSIKVFTRTILMFLFQASPDELEARLDNGLIIGHAYSITAVEMVCSNLFTVRPGGERLKRQTPFS